jgi:hypothetical protein
MSASASPDPADPERTALTMWADQVVADFEFGQSSAHKENIALGIQVCYECRHGLHGVKLSLFQHLLWNSSQTPRFTVVAFAFLG